MYHEKGPCLLRLKDFKGQIVITNVDGYADVITFQSTASKILQDFKSRASDDIEVEKMRIIKAAADIIKNEIKQLDTSMIFYPTFEEIENTVDFSSSKFTPQLYCICFRV